ncbi:MAG: chromosomal replication initiator protein [Candidatus Sumerlaeota bacterium]|nr:chromosomal replication initiator protein [Candidatus Sumerlaeota bacterium]
MTRLMQDTWERALENLRGSLGQEEYNAWISPIAIESFDEEAGAVTLSVSSEFYHNWIVRKYLDTIRAALIESNGADVSVQMVVRQRDTQGAPETGDASANGTSHPSRSAPAFDLQTRGARFDFAPKASPAGPRLSPRYTFQDFVVGESNRYAHAAAQAVADPKSQAFNPLFIYGPSGLGKTHLMQAIGHDFYRRFPGANVVYITSEQFINGFIESIQLKKTLEFRNQYRSVDLLLLDDVQFLMGKERTQHEVFHTFNSLFDAGKKIVLTSDRQPKELATLEDRLRSRFEWGVIADIAPPDLETRIAILRHKARLENIKVPTEVLQFIAEWVRSNIRELEGALKRIKVYSSLHNCPITMEACREVLSHLVVGQPQTRVTVEGIQTAVCEYFEITSQQLLGRNRSKKFSQPRHLALFLCREMTDLSFPDIAQKFGGKDHTSVIYAYRKIKKAVDEDPSMASIVNYLTKQIQQGGDQ